MKIAAGVLFLGLSVFLHSIELISSALDHSVNDHPAIEHPANEHPVNGHPAIEHPENEHSVNSHSSPVHSVNDHSERIHLLNYHSVDDYPIETTLRKLFPRAKSVADFPPLREINHQSTEHFHHFRTLNGQPKYDLPETYFMRGNLIVGWKKGNSNEPQHLGTLFFQEYPYVVFDTKSDRWYELKYTQFLQLTASPALAQLIREHDHATLNKKKGRNEEAHYEASWTAYRDVRVHAKYQAALEKVGVESKEYAPGTEKKLYEELYNKQYRKSVDFQHKYGL